jgi:hypothetical protein
MVAAGAAVAAFANAIKASGVVVSVTECDFQKLLKRIDKPLIVYSKEGRFSTSFQYLVSYKGLAFLTRCSNPIALPPDAEIIIAKKISVPLG